ncbi:MAG: response regulator transcription factor [Bacillota bacterium]
MRILVVEDDPATRAAVSRGLVSAHFTVDTAADGEEALLFLADRHYDAVILDRRLPGVSGETVLAELRRRGQQVPVLMLTALDRVSDRVGGLEAGADDYLVKPFAFEELVARIKALIRRAAGSPGEPCFGDFVLDRKGVAVRCGNRSVLLTPREFDILQALVQARGRPVPARALADAAWPEPWEASDEALWSHLKNLRKKLQAAGSRVTVRSRRQVGYYLDVEEGKQGHEDDRPPAAGGRRSP